MPHQGESCHWCKRFFKIHTFYLCISFCNKSSFVPCLISILIRLVLENPFVPITLIPSSLGTKFHTSFLLNCPSSSSIAFIQYSSVKASLTFLVQLWR